MIFRRTWEARAIKRVVNKPRAATRKTINQLDNTQALVPSRNVPGTLTTDRLTDVETKVASVVS
jgi:hypothetical protein